MILEAVYIILPIYIHDGQQQQELSKGKGHRIFRPMEDFPHHLRHRQAEPYQQHVVHGYIHEGDKEYHRPEQPPLHGPGFPLQYPICLLHIFLRLRPFDCSAIARRLHSANNPHRIHLALIIGKPP